MPVSLEECRAKFGEVWSVERDGETFVFRWPDPDAFDEAFALVVSSEKGGDFRHAVKAFEMVTKASCCSHTPMELDALRRVRPPRGYMLFNELGSTLMLRLRGKQLEQGKD